MGRHAEWSLSAAAALDAVPPLQRLRVVLGFDGFIDNILDVVASRQSPTAYTRLETIGAFGARISAVAGLSTNIERVLKQQKLGGNGPIMANALLGHQAALTYIGNLGEGAPAGVFQPMVDRLEQLINLGRVCATEAFEFDDGKIMFTLSEPLNAITFDALLGHCGGLSGLKALLREADGVATVNWTQILGMTDIWRRMAQEVLPGLYPQGQRPKWFIDLADPAKRSREDLADALKAARELQAHVDVVLGLNEEELRQVLQSLGASWNANLPPLQRAERGAVEVRERTGLAYVVIHFVKEAACAFAGGSCSEDGFFTAKPKITTGAGDHFNAGFFAALLSGLSPQQAIMVGTATSGYYVRSAQSPTRAQLAQFLRTGAV